MPHLHVFSINTGIKKIPQSENWQSLEQLIGSITVYCTLFPFLSILSRFPLLNHNRRKQREHCWTSMILIYHRKSMILIYHSSKINVFEKSCNTHCTFLVSSLLFPSNSTVWHIMTQWDEVSSGGVQVQHIGKSLNVPLQPFRSILWPFCLVFLWMFAI